MTNINMPGFTAERSLRSGNRPFSARASDTPFAPLAEIVPQGCYLIDGLFWCDLPKFPVPKPGPEHFCQFKCRQKFSGPGQAGMLAACLDNC
jgi:hypothetical protein